MQFLRVSVYLARKNHPFRDNQMTASSSEFERSNALCVKKPIQIFLYRPILIPITDITSFVIYAFFIMLNLDFLPSKLGDAGGASTPTHFCPTRGFLL